MTEFKINRRVVILTNQRYLFQANDKVRKLTEEGYKCEVVIMPTTLNKAEQLLARQPLGSVIGIYLEEDRAQAIEYLALSVGFSKNDIWINKSCEGNTRVFCSQCHLINVLSSCEIFECENCNIMVKPSTHYSTYHKAYLAYPIVYRENKHL